MTIVDEAPNSRQTRLRERLKDKYQQNFSHELDLLESRADYRPELAYFVKLFRDGFSPEHVSRRVERPVVNLLCLQAPLEMFTALGLHPYKVFSGSAVAGQLPAAKLPALMCPMIKAVLGAMELENDAQAQRPWVLPSTCDWMVKLKEMDDLCGQSISGPVHRLELPHLKDLPKSQRRWLEEIVDLRDFLEQISRKHLTRQNLLNSLMVYQEARRAFTRLIGLRREGLVPLTWFLLISNSFFLDTVENWTAALTAALPGFNKNQSAPSIFLAGSPVFFPNFKMAEILDKAGLAVAGDDLCSSERILPANVAASDLSEYGLIKALAETYHQGCLCPTFADNDRRINHIKAVVHGSPIKGLVFQVLKGCHPYDLESLALEEPLKKLGLKFIRLETDYTAEDGQNLLTRLEAFRRTLETA